MWRASVRVQCQRPGVKTTEVEACMAACVCFFLKLSQLRTMADKLYSSLLMDGRHEGLSCLTQVRTVYKLHSTDSAHDLLSPCTCRHNSCPDWPRADSHELCCYLWFVCHDNNQQMSMWCLLRLAPWCWSIFLVIVWEVLTFASVPVRHWMVQHHLAGCETTMLVLWWILYLQ